MTSEHDHIDHVAEAMNCVVHSWRVKSEVERQALLAQADVHATLAVAQQQRIANRLRLAALDFSELVTPIDVGFRVRDYLTDDDWASLEVVPQAKETK